MFSVLWKIPAFRFKPKGIRRIIDIVADALLVALDTGSCDIVEYLLSKGANPDGFIDTENHRPAPIFYAIRHNRLDLVKLLHEYKASLEVEW